MCHRTRGLWFVHQKATCGLKPTEAARSETYRHQILNDLITQGIRSWKVWHWDVRLRVAWCLAESISFYHNKQPQTPAVSDPSLSDTSSNQILRGWDPSGERFLNLNIFENSKPALENTLESELGSHMRQKKQKSTFYCFFKRLGLFLFGPDSRNWWPIQYGRTH
jgi:hypothetical protein